MRFLPRNKIHTPSLKQFVTKIGVRVKTLAAIPGIVYLIPKIGVRVKTLASLIWSVINGRSEFLLRAKLERLCRYITRPAVSTKRLSITRNGTVRYELKTPWLTAPRMSYLSHWILFSSWSRRLRYNRCWP
jgi:hypothetical protein